jgi:hypothetical protein
MLEFSRSIATMIGRTRTPTVALGPPSCFDARAVAMGIHSEAQLDVKFIDFARQLQLYLNHFPSFEKYGLSLQIRNAAYSFYGYVVESQKRYAKKTSLNNADITHEQLRMFVRLAFELGYFQFKEGSLSDEGDAAEKAIHRYLVISRMIDELGRMLGGWIQAERAKQPDGGQKREAS